MTSTGESVVLSPHWGELCTPEAYSPSVAVTRSFAPCYEETRDARELATTTLRRWGLGDLLDDVPLVVSELVTNALRHGLGLDRAPVAPDRSAEPSRAVRLCLARRGRHVVCAVRDPSGSPPVAGPLDDIAESGRGLHLVRGLSQEWGWYPRDTGKVVWALFHTTDG